MPATYRVTPLRRIINFVMARLIRWGLAPPHSYLLTVRGRRTGVLHTTPVTLVEEGGARWLVAPYGEVGWVQNARAAGQVTLTRGRSSETVPVREVAVEQRAPILMKYVRLEPIVRPYFEAWVGSPEEAFAAEAARHPVFRIETQ